MYGTINTEFYKTRGNIKYTQRLERTEFRMPYFFFRTILIHDIGSKKKPFYRISSHNKVRKTIA